MDPRIHVSALTGTHPLYLAKGLAERECLGAFYTTLPAWRTPGVPAVRTRRHLALLAGIYAVGRGWIPASPTRSHDWIAVEFDRWMAARLTAADVVQALPAYGLESRRAAKARFGALTVCDSGTSHERVQDAWVREEATRWDVDVDVCSEPHLSRVEREYEEADLVTVPSTFAWRSFVARGFDPAAVIVTPYGADLDEYAPCPKRDQIFRILFVGSVTVRKGVPYLLEAVGGLSMPDAEFCIRGARLSDAERLLGRYAGKVPMRFLEPQPRRAMRDLFSQASVLVLPSVEDGFGLVIPQAMACGVPVIASTNTGGPDLIDDGVDGVIVPARDSRALRDAIVRLYEDPELRDRMGRAARLKLERLGGWSTYVESVLRAYRAGRSASVPVRRGA